MKYVAILKESSNKPVNLPAGNVHWIVWPHMKRKSDDQTRRGGGFVFNVLCLEPRQALSSRHGLFNTFWITADLMKAFDVLLFGSAFLAQT